MSKPINATHYENIPSFPKGSKASDAIVHAIIETPQGSTHKYALEADLGIIALKQILAAGLRWPYDYGFVPQTIAQDGDPLDVLFVIDEPTFSGCLTAARVIGSVKMRKDGIENDRLIAVPFKMADHPLPTDDYRDLDDMPKKVFRDICSFLVDYPKREGHEIALLGHVGPKDAMKAVRHTMKAFERGAKRA